ncbi:MAG: hypothetical protein Q8941_21175 [Bacteroidota bacterium]|nr:hypothetical protein [Bacteroidota bacterium]
MHTIKENFSIYKGRKQAEQRFREQLSSLIIKTFGSGLYNQVTIRGILSFSIDYYIAEFSKITRNETSYTFYKFIFWLHEQATELNANYKHESFSDTITADYIACYRRVLKFIIEEGCGVQMKSGEKVDAKFKKRIEPILDNLLFLGEMIITCVNLYAEQDMIEDVAEIRFNKKNLYTFQRKHHYDFIFKHIQKELAGHLKDAIVDEKGHADLNEALHVSFGINYENVCKLIGSLHQYFKIKPGEPLPVNWEGLTRNLHGEYGVSLETADLFFRGLCLDNGNRMSLLDLARKPYNLNRFLYKPIVMWNIDSKDFAVLGAHSWDESLSQYVTNAIPWGKAPLEWMSKASFKKYVHRKEDDHDKWLDDEVESIVKEQGLQYDRNIKHLISKNGTITLLKKDVGEIDFLIIADKTKKLLVIDDKHLHGRYDTANQKNDFSVFTEGPKSYNASMAKKLEWANANKTAIEQHFQRKYHNTKMSLNDYSIEGVFIVNTPTLYMYNSTYRIYTIRQVASVLTGQHVDPTFAIMIEEDEQETILHVKYPYFRKPKYITFNADSEL